MDGTIKSVAKGVVTGSKEGNAPNVERSKVCTARLIVFPLHIEVNESKEGDSIVSFPSFRPLSAARIHPGITRVNILPLQRERKILNKK